MVESPQKKPRLYGITAFSSQAKNGMEADEMYRRQGGREGGRVRAKTKDGLMNVCGMCNEEQISEIQRFSSLRGTRQELL